MNQSYTLSELAHFTGSKLAGDPHHRIINVADLSSAGPEDASFLNKLNYGQTSRYEQAMRGSSAGVIFVHPDIPLMEGRNYLLNEDPSRAFQKTLELLNPHAAELSGFIGIHPTAIVHPSSVIGMHVHIGPHSVIDKDAVIGDHTHIGAQCFVGPRVHLGNHCLLHPRVTIREGCIIGNRVIMQPGSVIGSCGFGYTTDKHGHHTKLNQIGIVIIEDDVEIGANTTIDRGRFRSKSTIIGKGSKIDNLVQIGHGTSIGPDNMIVAQVGIAGSVETGQHVVMAGQSGVAGHIKLGAGVILTARTGVTKSLPQAGKYGGNPAIPLAEYNRMCVHFRKLSEHIDKLKESERRISAWFEKSQNNRIHDNED